MSGTLLRHVGLLVLDEPTGYLDERNLDKLPGLFRKIREFSAAAGLQLLVVTHEARVMGTFDNVITVS
jgi:DNA repair exonuclease SbcCD ATPase subunit